MILFILGYIEIRGVFSVCPAALCAVKAEGYGHLNRACLDLGVRRGNRGGDFIRVKALDLRLGSDHGDADILGGDLSLIGA